MTDMSCLNCGRLADHYETALANQGAELHQARQQIDDLTDGHKVQQASNAAMIGHLKRQIRDLLEDQTDTDFDDARRVFEHWKQVFGIKSKRVIWDADGDRAKLIRRALKWKFQDGTKVTRQDLCDAISGHGLKPHSGPRGWQAIEYAGSKYRNQIHHAIGDSAKFESWLAVWRKAQSVSAEGSAVHRDVLWRLLEEKRAEADHLMMLLLLPVVREEAVVEDGRLVVPDNVIPLRRDKEQAA